MAHDCKNPELPCRDREHLSANEQIAMRVYDHVKNMRGEFDADDPQELAELATMLLNTVIHLGGLVETMLEEG